MPMVAIFIQSQSISPLSLSLSNKMPFRHESLLLDSAHEKMTEVEKMFAMRGFQQDWNARKRINVPQQAPVVHPVPQ